MNNMEEKPDITQIPQTWQGNGTPWFCTTARSRRHLFSLRSLPISNRFGIDVDIIYSGEISHQQNVALVKLLGINMSRYDPTMDLGGYQGAIFIDHQGTTVEEIVTALEAAGIPILMVVDHHQPQKRLKPQFSDIRPVGSTATIYTNYLECEAVEMDAARKEHVLVATALMHGIMTDTQGFIRASAEDLHAAAYLSRFRCRLIGPDCHPSTL
jgi:nanoRNase/pAp phosphatase (c-di-AMP/oligoRNAs hydrolase)